MSEGMTLFMGEDPQHCEPRFRLAGYLKRQYRLERFAAQRFAKDIGCTAKTAENIFDAHWPSSRHMQRIVARFGRDVLDAVFAPDIDATVARLKREEAELERLLADKRSRRIAAEGVGAGDPQPVEARQAVEDRSFRPRVVR